MLLPVLENTLVNIGVFNTEYSAPILGLRGGSMGVERVFRGVSVSGADPWGLRGLHKPLKNWRTVLYVLPTELNSNFVAAVAQ